jgi:4-hydroxybenzoate polyprenyltransferase
MLIKRLSCYAKLMRLDKPIGILLLGWPTLWALWFAGAGKPDIYIVSIFMLGVVLMRSAGCVANDLADRHLDGFVKRTQARPLAAKTISVKAAIIVFISLSAGAFLLVLQLNRLTICLAIVGMVLAIAYPFMKRFTHWPQVGLGAAFSWGVPMAYAAENNSVPLSAWLLFATALLWPIIYDTMYAMTDREDDRKIGIKSTAILFGLYDKKIIALLQVIFLGSLAWIGYILQLHWPYYLGLILSAGLFCYQQKLIQQRLPEQCFKAFLNNNWVGFSIFVGIVWSYAL